MKVLQIILALALGFGSLSFGSLSSAHALQRSICWDRDCLHRGWTTQDSQSNVFQFDLKCRDNDCVKNGWITGDTAGHGVYTQCKGRGCMLDGWYEIERLTHRLLRQTECLKGPNGAAPDCLKYGWFTYESGQISKTTCYQNDCRQFGWITIVPGAQSRRAFCAKQDCFAYGWVIAP